MNSGPQLALGLAAGYLLGRKRRMRLALMIGAAAVTGGVGGVGRRLLRKGTKLAASNEVISEISPALREVTGVIRGDLVYAAKDAALAAASSRIDSLSDSLHSRAEALQHPLPEPEEELPEPEEEEPEEDDDTVSEGGGEMAGEPPARWRSRPRRHASGSTRIRRARPRDDRRR